MKSELTGADKRRWIFESGWKGLCPRCGEGKMFDGWLKITKRCDSCGLNYEFAQPDDGPAFFAMCVVAFPLLFVIVGFEVLFQPAWWIHIVVSLPVMIGPCLASLRPIKGWLVASQYLNKAQEAGTDALWADLHARARDDGAHGEDGNKNQP
jgi:uncharacterized protein (DUF983 family)